MTRKQKMLIALGVLIALVPHIGLPTSFKNILLTIFGVLVVLLGYFLHKGLKNLPMKAQDLHPLKTGEKGDE